MSLSRSFPSFVRPLSIAVCIGLIGLGALFPSISLAELRIPSSNLGSDVGQESVGVHLLTCSGTVVAKPKSFIISCADGYQYLQKIVWTTWGPSSAKGTGTYYVNDCTPYCAAGKFHSYTSSIKLSRVKSTKFGKLFSYLELNYKQGTKPRSLTTSLVLTKL